MRTSDRTSTITHDFIVGHKYEVRVQAVGPDGTMQATENAPCNAIVIHGKQSVPAAPEDLATAGFLNSITLTWTNPTDHDFDRVEIWQSATNHINTASMIAEIKGITYIDPIGSGNVTRYYWLRAVNTSGLKSGFEPEDGTGTGVSGTSDGVTATDIDDFSITATKMWTNTVILTGDAWTNNSPVGGSIAWNSHHIVYNGVSYPIAAGNTVALLPTATVYVYWTIGAAAYSISNTHPTLGITAFMIAINTAGIHTLVWNSSANMVIGTAFIADLAVTNAKIADLNAAKITAGTIASQQIVLGITAGTGDCAIRAGKTDFTNTQTGFILGLDDSDGDKPKFYIGDATNYLNWTGVGLVVKGGITTNTGSVISTGYLSGLVSPANIALAERGWVQTCAFSMLDADTVQWGAGTFTATDGTAYSISAGNTGNMAAKTYIYLDITTSTTTYQVTTTPTAVLGTFTVFVAVAQNGTVEPTWEVLQSQGGKNINAAEIVAGSITANEIAANTITAAQISTLIINAGKVTASYLTADNITTGTLTAITVQTASGTGQRVIISQADNTLKFYNASNKVVVDIDDDANGYAIIGDQTTKNYTQVRNGVVGLWHDTATTVILFGAYHDGLAWDYTVQLDNVGNLNLVHGMYALGGNIDCRDVRAIGVVKIDGTQVISNQGAAIANATDAASVILRLNDLLAACRTHGLIASS